MELVCVCGSPVPVVDDDARAVPCPGCTKPVTVPEPPAAVQLSRIVDNPIVLRATFAKLRMPGAWIGIGIVAVLCVLIVGGAFAIATTNRYSPDALPSMMSGAFWFIFFIQAMVLFFGGTNSIASGISQDRESGVFEMMKMTPRTNPQLLAGYLLGMPLREHLWAFVCAPFAGVAAILGKLALHRLVVLYVVLYACALMAHCFAAFIGTTIRNRRAAGGMAVGMPMLAMFLSMFTPGFIGLHLTIFPTLIWAGGGERQISLAGDASFFGFPLPVAAFDSALIALVGSAFWFATMRKLRSEDTPALSKPVALLYAVAAQIIIVGAFWDFISGSGTPSSSPLFRSIPGLLEGGFLLCGAALAMILVAMGTPHARLYQRMARRALKLKHGSIGALTDAGLNPLHAVLIALPSAVSALLVPGDIPARVAAGMVTFSSIYAMAALMQWTKLRTPRSWAVIFAACLFGLWGIPIILAVICGIADAGAAPAILLGGLFPGIGIVGAVAQPVAGFIIGIVNLVIGGVLTGFTRSAALTYWTR